MVRSYRDLTGAAKSYQLYEPTFWACRATPTNRRITQGRLLFRYESAECNNWAEMVRPMICKFFGNGTLHLPTWHWKAGSPGSYRCEEESVRGGSRASGNPLSLGCRQCAVEAPNGC